jgi:hypothetical protein
VPPAHKADELMRKGSPNRRRGGKQKRPQVPPERRSS